MAAHEAVIDGWKKAVQVAERAQEGGYWPVHVNDEGMIEPVLPPDPDTVLGKTEIDINEAIAESIEVAMSESKEDK